MTEILYKKVLMPIDVPNGEYCWDSQSICPHFDNNNCGRPRCSLGLGHLKYHHDYPHLFVLKPEECASLKGTIGDLMGRLNKYRKC